MKNIFAKAFQFIKENPSILFSLVLVVLIPAAFFLNTYFINSSYEENIDKITQRKAVLVESVVNSLVGAKISENEGLQSAIERIAKENSEIVSLTISEPRQEQNAFRVVAASEKELVGKEQTGDIQEMIAWSKSEGVAFLDRSERERFWKVTKALTNGAGEKIGIISISFSLQDSDALVSRTIYNSYWLLILTVLIVILLVSNQARLFGYALAVSRLREVDKMKDMFISMASHELRTPLTAISGNVEFLREKKELMGNQESAHFLDNISVSVSRLQDLVNDILEVSRVEGNRLPIEMTGMDPREIIAQSVEEVRSSAERKGLAINYQAGAQGVIIKADPNRLKQVLVNLIGNAIKYTEKGSVDVSVAIKNNKLAITVADTGIGISSEDQANLFQKFYRVQNEKTQGVVGTGLGLWLTLEIIKRMNGKITVESIEGVGSHFTVQFPVVKK